MYKLYQENKELKLNDKTLENKTIKELLDCIDEEKYEIFREELEYKDDFKYSIYRYGMKVFGITYKSDIYYFEDEDGEEKREESSYYYFSSHYYTPSRSDFAKINLEEMYKKLYNEIDDNYPNIDEDFLDGILSQLNIFFMLKKDNNIIQTFKNDSGDSMGIYL